MAQTQGQPVKVIRQRKEGTSALARAEERTALWLLAPTFLTLLVLAIYPLGQVFVQSFTDARFATAGHETSFVGFSNYRNLLSMTIRELPPRIDEETGQPIVQDGVTQFESPFRILPREPVRYGAVGQFGFGGRRYVLGATSPDFIRAIWDTLVVTVIGVSLQTILGMVIALTVATKFLGRGVMRAAMLVPWAIITVVSARIWEWMLEPDRKGLFNTVFSYLGLSDGFTNWTGNPSLQLPSLIAMEVWKTTPFMALLLLAGLSTISGELYEAAEIDGANKVRQFFSITLPLLMPTLAVALVFRTLDTLRIFDAFQVIFGEGRLSMASFAYFQLIGARNVGLSSAASVIIFFLLFGFAFLYIRILRVDTE
ncbi:carbohydrate ABC transporter permease [Truepera radiovictrix]|uniref:Binding-protein-dependent transport systems inner membrane component n=1 Tax=Truepera radiovictrix (strain DSM 17093 / CIP 108686 / LMG 22925 / RQ-24) TaxID=649638 RepID=D7CSY6_TRURR|nr:sugar ABC transporter permease [Truepera radiovictrix]ADI13753.1 binding-protein-dependent transport systems inner membrane component [Truepera radiovictrix DSM 17093]WMT57682.1 sugar ABC transporter permease [Truepera radiovictrix]